MTIAELEKRIVKPRKILTIDIERHPGQAYFYDARTEYIRPGNVQTYPRTVCFAARWYGSPEPIFAAEWHKGGQEAMLEKAWKLYDQAEIIYTYNGKRFDDKHLKAEWAMMGLPRPLPWKPYDLLALVRSEFGFEHKSLDAVTRRLGRPGKEHPFDLRMILEACAGDKHAQADMRSYNIGDIELTEWLADRLRPWMFNHPHIGGITEEKRCHACGSEDLRRQKSTHLAVLIERVLYRCGHCQAPVVGGWHARSATTRGVR